MRGKFIPPTKPTFLDLLTRPASAPTRNEPSSSRNLSAARLGGGGMTLPSLSVAAEQSTTAEPGGGGCGAGGGAVGERLVAAPAHVEHHADVDGVARGRGGGAGRMHEKKG